MHLVSPRRLVQSFYPSLLRTGLALAYLGLLLLVQWLLPGSVPDPQDEPIYSQAPLLLAFADETRQAAFLSGLEAAERRLVFSLDDSELALTNFRELETLPYPQLLKRLIEDDPRATDFLDLLPRLFTAMIDGQAWSLAYILPGPPELRQSIHASLAADPGGWRLGSETRRGRSRLWYLPAGFLAAAVFLRRRPDYSLYRLLLHLAWLPLALGPVSLWSSCLAIAAMMAVNRYLQLSPPRPEAARWLRVSLAPWQAPAFLPYLLLLPLLAGPGRGLWPWILVGLLLSLAVVGLRRQLLTFEAGLLMHRPPAFRTMAPRLQPPEAFSGAVGLAALSLCLLLYPLQRPSGQEFSLFSAVEDRAAIIEAGFDQHVFTQLALTRGILGSLDRQAWRFDAFQLASEGEETGQPGQLSLGMAELAEELSAYRQDSRLLTLVTAQPTGQPEPRNLGKNYAQPLDTHTLLVAIIVLGLLWLATGRHYLRTRGLKQCNEQGIE